MRFGQCHREVDLARCGDQWLSSACILEAENSQCGIKVLSEIWVFTRQRLSKLGHDCDADTFYERLHMLYDTVPVARDTVIDCRVILGQRWCLRPTISCTPVVRQDASCRARAHSELAFTRTVNSPLMSFGSKVSRVKARLRDCCSLACMAAKMGAICVSKAVSTACDGMTCLLM